jgi:uncharacterized lipoprotein YehR (DUF1307 family)
MEELLREIRDDQKKMLENQYEMGKSIVGLETRMNNKDRRLEKVETDTESLKKFKWGVTGFGGVSIIAIIEELWRNIWSQ